MKYTKFLSLFAAASLMIVACDKTSEFSYQAAETPTGEQVFFPKDVDLTYNMGLDDTYFTVPVYRANSELDAVDVAITSSGEGLDYFEIPGSVTFASGQSQTTLDIAIKNADALGQNNFYDVTLEIADGNYQTEYGLRAITLSAGVSLPKIVFDEGTMIEACWWGETEPDKVMYYQEVALPWVKCTVEDCFGYETIASGYSYDVQDYVWYWNTETNYCVVPMQYMGYMYQSAYPTCVSDAASFYYYYKGWASDIGAVGSEDYLNWAVNWMNNYGYQTPYYDGNGTFYLGSWYTVWGDLTFSSYVGAFASEGDYDMFVGANFADYTISAEYDGMYVNVDMEAVPIINFYGNAETVESIYYVIVSQDEDPEEVLAAILDGSRSDLSSVVLKDGTAQVMPELEPGLYRIVAVPYDGNGYQEKYYISYDFYFPGANAESVDVDASFYVLSVASLYGSETAEKYGYYDYNSCAYYIKGSEIKSGKYLFSYASSFEGYTDDEISELVNEYGYDLDDDDITSINEKGYTVGIFGGTNNPLNASTEYEIAATLTNVYGTTALFTGTYTTTEDTSSSDSISRDTASRTMSLGEKSNLNIKITGVRINAGWGRPTKSADKDSRNLIEFNPETL